jgi:hypothetical protein
VEVDPVALPIDLGIRVRQAGGADDPQEASLELGIGQAEGVAVEEGAGRGGDREPAVGGEVGVRERTAAVDSNPGRGANNCGTEGDVDGLLVGAASAALREDSPVPAGGLVAESGPGSAAEDGGHEAALLGELGSADRVDAAIYGVQPALGDPMPDGHRLSPSSSNCSRDTTPCCRVASSQASL